MRSSAVKFFQWIAAIALVVAIAPLTQVLAEPAHLATPHSATQLASIDRVFENPASVPPRPF